MAGGADPDGVVGLQAQQRQEPSEARSQGVQRRALLQNHVQQRPRTHLLMILPPVAAVALEQPAVHVAE